MNSHAILSRLLEPARLTQEEAWLVMELMLDESISDTVKGAALALLKTRTISGRELAAFATFLTQMAEKFDVETDSLLDTCGTGGGLPSFNISTASAIVAASAGARVAKHGNRAVTSRCGSADVLEKLGICVQSNPEIAKTFLDQTGIAFLFAPNHHPTLKHVGAVRKELGFRTLFNQLGPLANPLRAQRQLLGVYSPELVVPMAEALSQMSSRKAVVVHSKDGLDEISPCSDSISAWVNKARVYFGDLELSEFKLKPIDPKALEPGKTLEEASEILLEAISDHKSLRFQAILPSAAMALHLCDLAPDLPSAVELATSQVQSGAAIAKLKQMQALSKEFQKE